MTTRSRRFVFKNMCIQLLTISPSSKPSGSIRLITPSLSTLSELKQLHDMHVGKPIKAMVSELKHEGDRVQRIFYKEVFDLRTGAPKKRKFRIVPHGHLLDRCPYKPQETTSPTVSIESIFTFINIAAKENRKAFTMDIPGAYLNADLKDKHVVRFPRRDLAAEYVALYSTYLLVIYNMMVLY
jgi:hypothetical protein